MNVGLLRQKDRQDLVDIVRNYVQTAGMRVALRSLVEVENTISRLAGMPGTGAIYDSINLILKSIYVTCF
jgi:plasmid stabilization system protein ParE